MQNIFCQEEDFKTAMWILAATLHLFKGVRAITFELMSNHLHLILAGRREDCIKAFDIFATRLKLAFPKSQRAIDWRQFKVDILPIENLQALRNEIIYVNRNAFVANPAYTVKSKYSTNNFKKIRIPQFSETRFGSFVGLFCLFLCL